MKAYISDLKQRLAPQENAYLKALRKGEMSRADFLETQIQFKTAVAFFNRPMTMLAARLPSPAMRWGLLNNVRDEHGDGDFQRSHEATFLEFLRRLGATPEEVDRRTLWPELRAFNTVLIGLCVMDDTLTALAALGMIEDLFAGISAEIGEAVLRQGWLRRDEIIHYKTHETLDVEHAEGFYRLLYRHYESDAKARYFIEQGLELGGYVFMGLYWDLYRNRERRWMRDVMGPHSEAAGETPYPMEM